MAGLHPVHPWFETPLSQVVALHSSGRLPHALLLHGVAGIGKNRLAQAVANYLLCHQPETGVACGHCKGCELNRAGSHPDLFQLMPEEPGKQLKVDQVRNLGDFIFSTAQQGGYRVVIIDPADALNLAAANALLKMLEEPGQKTLLLLITARMGQLLPTIKSRCQHIQCTAPSAELAQSWLLEQMPELDAELAQQVLSVNRGSPEQALQYLQQSEADLRQLLVKGLADILRQRRSPLEVAAQWHRQDVDRLLNWFYAILTDILRQTLTEGGHLIEQSDAKNMIAAVAKKANPVKILKLADKIVQERRAILQRQNPNKQLLLESLLLQWSVLFRQE
ncbi:DNA polymerase III subunit delta' [Pontibacter sp. JAM-7]|uniref:DNA polymerase III subunit delta' n=1 Tax=Pontibacter sp. JAM-7 TaxID=3366581 RepID=UPI003AF9632F